MKYIEADIEEFLFVIVDEMTGEEIEREWYPADSIKVGDFMEFDMAFGHVKEIIIENADTRRVILTDGSYD